MINEIHHRSFCSLFGDSIHFEKMSRNEVNALYSQRYARISTICSLLTLESAANCCLFCVEGNNQLIEEIDKLSPLAKFDFFATHGFQKKMDWGRVEVQQAKELKQLRDSLAHPKVIRSSVESASADSRFSANGIIFSTKPKNATKIDANSNIWFHKEALSALQSIVGFYNYFFSELLGLDPDLVFGMLNTAVIENGKPTYSMYPPQLYAELEYVSTIGIEVKFMRSKI